MFLDIGLGSGFWIWHKSTSNKIKNQQVGLHQIKKLLQSKKKKNQQSEKANYGMGENMWKYWKYLIRVNIQIHKDLIQLNNNNNKNFRWIDSYLKIKFNF